MKGYKPLKMPVPVYYPAPPGAMLVFYEGPSKNPVLDTCPGLILVPSYSKDCTTSGYDLVPLYSGVGKIKLATEIDGYVGLAFSKEEALSMVKSYLEGDNEIKPLNSNL